MNNPVAWQLWNHVTVDLAKDRSRLIFLSIGYAACHCKYSCPDTASKCSRMSVNNDC